MAGRASGTRTYAVRAAAAPDDTADPDARLDALIEVIVHKYAALPDASVGQRVTYLGRGVPQWEAARKPALQRARQHLRRARVEGIDWWWPVDERADSRRWKADDQVRLLTVVDPVVWDRRRFQLFWGWAYRFEAYTPAPRRKLGYYALPLLCRERLVGWGNLAVVHGECTRSCSMCTGRCPMILRLPTRWTRNWRGCVRSWAWASGSAASAVVGLPAMSIPPALVRRDGKRAAAWRVSFLRTTENKACA